MADLSTNFLGVTSPNPFWLASAPPTDKEYNVVRAFEAGTTIADGSSIYGATLSAGAVNLGTVISGDVVSAGTVTVNTAGHTSTSNHLKAGSYTGIESVSTLSGTDAANYSFTGATGN